MNEEFFCSEAKTASELSEERQRIEQQAREAVELARARAATPHDQLIAELLDSRVPKTEREHAAAREIKQLRTALAQHTVDSSYAHRLAIWLECALLDRPGSWNGGHALLDEYRAACRSAMREPATMGEESSRDRAKTATPCVIGDHMKLPPVLDVCCGSRAMWFDKTDSRAIYLDRRSETLTEIYRERKRDLVIAPDIVADFTDLPFPDNTFALVVMDPPHVQREEMLGIITKRYGCLNGDWRGMLRDGFAECFRVLRPEGTLIFKWSSVQFPLKDILPLALPHKPLFGHRSGKRMNTHWVAFIKPSAPPQPA